VRREKLADLALQFLGYPAILYKNPDYGKDETGFDCSGFVHFLLKKMKFPEIEKWRHVNEMFDGLGVLIHPEFSSKGDLVFFSRDGVVPRHIGIMVSESHYIHSPGVNFSYVRIDEIKKSEIPYKNAQIYGHNPIGFKRLAIKKGRYKYLL